MLGDCGGVWCKHGDREAKCGDHDNKVMLEIQKIEFIIEKNFPGTLLVYPSSTKMKLLAQKS